MALPVLTLAIGEAAYILRTTRGAITSVLDRPFVTFLRAKGISPRRIVFGHALRNAGPSIVTVIGIQVGVLLGGAIIIETMFALPGVGRLIVTAINQRNYPVVQVGRPRDRHHLHRRVAGRPTSSSAGSIRASRTGASRERDHERRRPPGPWTPRRRRASAALLLAGAVLLAVLALVAIAAPCSRRTTPRRWTSDRVLGRPDAAHPFGSDVLGRDVLSRVIYGLRASLARRRSRRSLALARRRGAARPRSPATSVAGSTAAISRVLDMILVLPAMLLAITFIAMLGPGSVVAAIAIAVIYLPILARVMRTSTLIVTRNDYVAGARARGASHLRVLIGHVAPNALGPVVVQASVLAAFALQLEAGLSFLGLGTQPPTPSLGGMLAEGRDVLIQAPWVEIFPGLAIVVAVLAFTLLGEGLRRAVRPRGGGGVSAVARARRRDRHRRLGALRCRRGRVPAVDSVSLDPRARARSSARRRERQRQEHARQRRAWGSCRRIAQRERQHPRRRPRDASGSPRRSCARVRGDEVAMIFQDASASLDPTWPVGRPDRGDDPRPSTR